MGRKIKDLTGQRFGRLTVIKSTGKRNTSTYYWLCQCDCGNLKEISGGDIVRGHTTSCGCYRDTVGDNFRKKPKGESNRNNVYIKYKNQSKERGYSFSLTIEQCEIFFQGNCYYCGAKPSNIAHSLYSNGDYIYNGIDRVDNSLGYTVDNCVSCCWKCNENKRSVTSNIILRAAQFILSKTNK